MAMGDQSFNENNVNASASPETVTPSSVPTPILNPQTVNAPTIQTRPAPMPEPVAAPKENAVAKPAASIPAAPRPAAVRSSGASPKGAYVQRSEREAGGPSRSSFGPKSTYTMATPGRKLGMLGAAILAISMLLPIFIIDLGGTTDWTNWFKYAKETKTYLPYVVFVASLIAILLAYADKCTTKVFYFMYAVLVGYFCVTQIDDINKFINDFDSYFRNEISRSFGFYGMVFGSIVVMLSGIFLLINCNYNEEENVPTNHNSIFDPDRKVFDPTRKPGPDEWQCFCGRINPNFTGTCPCGRRKSQSAVPVVKEEKAPEQKPESKPEDPEIMKRKSEETIEAKKKEKEEILKMYKGLFDSGIITEEEYNDRVHYFE